MHVVVKLKEFRKKHTKKRIMCCNSIVEKTKKPI